MPSFTNFQQLAPVDPQTWWSFSSAAWTTVSFSTSTWVISSGTQTLTFRSTSGFTAPRFTGDLAGGTVEAIELRTDGVLQASVTGLAALGATPSDVSSNPLALLSRADSFVGSAGVDFFWGQNGNDNLQGGAGDDNLQGDDVSDTFFGNDTVDGGAGDDYLYGGRGQNLLTGGDGADLLSTLGGSASGGAGADLIYGTDSTLHGDDGADTINASASAGVSVSAYGDAGDDVLNANVSIAGGGAITLDGGAGTDKAVVNYYGGAMTPGHIGNVTLVNIEQLELSARASINLAAYGPAKVALYGDIRFDGSSGADTVTSGGAGAQTIAGGLGDDVLAAGDDSWGGYTLPYFPHNTVSFPVYRDIVDYSSATTGVTVDLRIATAQNTGQGMDTLTGFEGVIGSAYNDVLTGHLGDIRVRNIYSPNGGVDQYLGASLDGGAGNDQLTGTSEVDTLSGGTGADTLAGDAGDDRLDGGRGADFMTGGGGADTFGVSLDGGVDTITDFDVSTDKLLLTGELADYGGLLIWNKGLRQLLWDADGDAGPGGPVVVAELGGSVSGTLSRATLAAEFTPAALRTIASDGTVTNVQINPIAPQVGTAGRDILIGTAGADTLQGLGGDDVLDGRGGPDVMTGGLGADRYHLMLDGSVDQLTDFNSAQGDFLAVVDTNGELAGDVSGLLIWNTGTGVLSWDSDSDAGPSAAVAIAHFGADASVNLEARTSFAAGFQPSAVRELAGDGRVVEIVFDWGSQAFEHTRTGFTAAHQAETYDTYFDSGAKSNRYWDVNNTQTWDSRVADYDLQGGMTAYGVSYDDGSRQVFQFDTLNVKFWERLVESYDALGRLTEQGIKFDDGTASERFVDTYDTQPWAYSIDNYDAAGRLLNHTLYKPDGSVFVG